jgi:hypothetical protein
VAKYQKSKIAGNAADSRPVTMCALRTELGATFGVVAAVLERPADEVEEWALDLGRIEAPRLRRSR